MIDQVFFYLLLPLPLVTGAMAIVYGRRAWQTRTSKLRRSRFAAAAWLVLCMVVLLFCRERIRGWTGFDSALAALMLLSTSGVLIAGALLIGGFAAWGRSTGGAPLCPGCWYDLEGVESGESEKTVCPECGYAVASRGDLIRRKRWPVLVAFAVALQLGSQFAYQLIRADHGGVQDFIPTTVLVGGMFSLPSEAIIAPPSPFDNATLAGRLANSRTADWQRSWVTSKSLGALERSSSPEVVRRAVILLGRMQYEGEMSVSAWQNSVIRIAQLPDGSAEAFAYLAECYIRTRSHPEMNIRITPPLDAAQCDKELKEVAPALLKLLKRSNARGQEWWAALRIVTLSTETLPQLTEHLAKRVLLDESDTGRAYSAAVLAMISGRSPQSGDAACEAFALLPGPEKLRVLNAIVRYISPSVSLRPSFQALAQCGDPTLETVGAVALTGDPAARCEGAEVLVAAMKRHAEFGVPDLSFAYWCVARSPGDDASCLMVSAMIEMLFDRSPVLQGEAMANLSPIARDFDEHAPAILHVLDLLGDSGKSEFAERARSLAVEIRSARSAPPQLRKVATIP
ncbi:MAG: hypothetical protein JSS51_03945 [Planctomycetes bacterium]|nr:hypothetical protein [Planctomycetota bacterium]